jgi:protein required for attachment to host cells
LIAGKGGVPNQEQEDMRSERTWIVLADGAHARVLEHSAGASGLEPVNGLTFDADLPPTHEIVSDRPGRTFESKGKARHAKTGRSDPHRELKRGLAKELAVALKSSLAKKRYEHLVLVAPPATLGDLREALTRSVQARVTAELAQDLVKTPQSQLRRHLRDVLPAGTTRPTIRRQRTAAPRGATKK